MDAMAALEHPPRSDLRVAIIGGGYAGMAAAVSLVDAGIQNVTVYEAGPVLGGRARRIPGGNGDDDNGQHLCLGAYTALLKLMAHIGADSDRLFYRSPLRLIFGSSGKKLAGQRSHAHSPFSVRSVSYLPAPINLIAAILTTQGVSFEARWKTLMALHQLRQLSFLCLPGQTVAALLDQLGIRGTIRTYFWESLCLAALNTRPEIACAQTFLNILQDIADGPRQASDLLIPRVDLSALFPEPAARYIEARGAEIYTGCAIKTLLPAGKLVQVSGVRHQRLYHHVILATPPRSSAALLKGWPEIFRPLRDQLLSLPHERIATLTLDYASTPVRLPFPMMGVTHSPVEWIFDRTQLMAGKNKPHLKKSGRIACVISAPPEAHSLNKDTLTEAGHAAVQAITGTLPFPTSSRLVVEKFATLSCRPLLARPEPNTPDPRLILAGDYLRSRYPSTLETAVRSGLEAARITLDRLSSSSDLH